MHLLYEHLTVLIILQRCEIGCWGGMAGLPTVEILYVENCSGMAWLAWGVRVLLSQTSCSPTFGGSLNCSLFNRDQSFSLLKAARFQSAGFGFGRTKR